MKFLCKFLRRRLTEDDKTELTLLIENYLARKIIKDLETNKQYRAEISEVKEKRSVQANNLMWQLIHDISLKINGSRANSIDDWDIYINALERAGARYEYVATLPQAEGLLKAQFRAVKYMNSFEHEGTTFNTYKVYCGSSKMNTTEMNLLIETVKDMAQEVGVDTSVYEI